MSLEAGSRRPHDAAGPPVSEEVEDDEVLLRRLPDGSAAFVAIDQLTGAIRPASGAFKPDADGVSVYRERILQEWGLSARDLIRAPLNQLVRMLCLEIRGIGLVVRSDPWPPNSDDPAHHRNAAHALIVGWQGLGKNERLRRQRELARLPSVAFVDLSNVRE